VPVLVEEGAWVYESAICNEYLEEKYPEPALAPADAVGRSRMRLWVEFCNREFVPPVITLLYQMRRAPQERRPEKIAASREKLEREVFPRLEETLRGADYLVGAYGIADLAFTPFVALCERLGMNLSAYPAVGAWFERLKARASYEEVKLGLAA
jgi:glutathione S-transferase